MRRLGILTPAFERGGSEEYVIALSRWASEHGWCPTVCLPDVAAVKSIRSELATVGIPTADLTAWPLFEFSEERFLAARRDAISLIRTYGFERLIIVLPTIEYGGALIDAAAALDIPAAVIYQLVPYPHRFLPIEQHIYTRARRQRQAWIAVSQHNRDLLCSSLGWSEDAVVAVHNSLQKEVQRPDAQMRLAAARALRSELGQSDTTAILLTVARLHHQKGYDVYIDALERLAAKRSDFHCVWVGGGELEQHLRDQLRIRQLASRVTLLGVRNDIVQLLHAASVFVLPSRFEGCPFAAMEAMAAGTPVILSDIGPHRELALDGDALLVPVEDPAALANAIAETLDHPDAAEARAQAALMRAAAFRPGRSFDRVMALLLTAEQRACRIPPWPLVAPTRPRIAIFGAGSAGRQALRQLAPDYTVVAFLDSRAGEKPPPVDGCPVVRPECVSGLTIDAVVVASLHADAMCETLFGLGYPKESVIRFPVDRLATVG